MDIKQLQNNFTTPEQSKRLLELGVPADSADCYYQDYGSIPMVVWTLTQPRDLRRGVLKPCWSVGRLREIFCICSSVNGTREYPFCNDQVAWWITEFEFKKEFIDFSKLED